MELKTELDAMKFAGFFIPFDEKVSKLRKCWFLFNLIPHTSTMFIVVPYFYFLEVKTLPAFIELVLMTIGATMTVFQRTYIYAKKDELEDLIQQLNDAPDCECDDFVAWEAEMKVTSRKNIRSLGSVMYVYTVVCCVFVYGLPFISSITTGLLGISLSEGGYRYLYFKVWWPTDLNESPSYFGLMTMQFLVCYIYAITNWVSDAFACSLIVAASERCAFLSRVAPQALLPGPNGEITLQFRAWVNYHQQYLRILTQVNKIMNPLIFAAHFVASTKAIALVYISSRYKDDNTVENKIANLGLLLANFLQVFIYSTAGQRVLDKSVELRNSVLGAAQVSRGGLKAGPACSGLQVIVTRVAGGAPPEEINAMGYFPICVETFGTILSASVSYSLILFELQ